MIKTISKLTGLALLYILGWGSLVIYLHLLEDNMLKDLLSASYAVIIILGTHFYVKNVAPIAQLSLVQKRIVTTILALIGAASILSSVLLVAFTYIFVGIMGASSQNIPSIQYLMPILLIFHFIFNIYTYKGFNIDISPIRVFIYLSALQIPLYFLYYLYAMPRPS